MNGPHLGHLQAWQTWQNDVAKDVPRERGKQRGKMTWQDDVAMQS